MKRTIIFLLLLACVLIAQAQKIDQRLTRLVEQSNTRRAQGLRPLNADDVNKEIAVLFNADGTVKSVSAIATLKDGAVCPTEQLNQMGIDIRFQLGNMVALHIPADHLKQLEQVDEFSYISADEVKRVMNDEARKSAGVNQVNTPAAAQTSGLPQAYTGSGVVIGVIDRGIDYNHAAFRNADGSTRIKKVIQYSEEADALLEFTPDYTNLTTDDPNTSHGSHTSATAGGTDTGNGWQGMAPEADLVLAGLGTSTTDGNIVAAMKKIFEYADLVKKPAVINISLGGVAGLHDGSDMMAQGIAELTENGTKPGRAVVCSSANSAAMWQSIIKTMPNTSDELKTVLGASAITNDNQVQYSEQYYMYASDYQDFTPRLVMIDLKTGNTVDMQGHVKDAEGEIYNANTIKLISVNEKPLKGGNAKAWYVSFVSSNVFLDNPSYRLAIMVKAGHDGQTINMMCTGDGNREPCFDAPQSEGNYNFAANGWTKGNSDFACNTSICNDAVISVGAYVTKDKWNNYLGTTYNYPESSLTGAYQQVGEIADFSSYCIDDNGKARPTLIAPGMGLTSAANSYDQNYFQQAQPGVVRTDLGSGKYTLNEEVKMFERSNWYLLTQGTSMSSPVATGIVALWMQANPQLTVNQIIDIMKETCDNDEWTTDVSKIPSHNKVQAGFGKINCLKGLKKILGATAIDRVAIDGHRQATPATMYSVDAPVFNIMGQQVDKSHKGIVIYKGRKYVNK